jgi:hypothetical protein
VSLMGIAEPILLCERSVNQWHRLRRRRALT